MEDYRLKIEVFKITLNHNEEKITDPNFRNFLDLKFSKKEKDLSDSDLFIEFNTDLSNKLNNKGEYLQIGKGSKRAFSVLNLPILDSKNQYIYGVLKGGLKGDNKTSSDFSNKETDESLDDKVINNKHFFLLYLPLESNVGFVFFQGYPQENIRLEFLNFLSRNVFKLGRSYNKIHQEPYLPKELKTEFSKGASISQLTFSDRVLSSDLSGKGTYTNGPSHYRLKVIIEPVGDGVINVDDFEKNYLEKFISKTALGKSLKKFNTKKGRIKKNSRETPFKIGGINEILPIIHLGEEYVDERGTPLFNSVKKYCLKVLESIKTEVYKKNKLID